MKCKEKHEAKTSNEGHKFRIEVILSGRRQLNTRWKMFANVSIAATMR